MESGVIRRRTVALIAAYATALQMLLSAFVPIPAAVFADRLAVLCTHDAGGGTGQPASHELPCAAICAALGHGIAGPVPPAVVVALAVPHAIVALAPVAAWVPPRLAVRTPQAPRGPPLA